MSFTYIKNIIGAKTDPCGTPLFTSLHSDFSSSTTVLISLPFRLSCHAGVGGNSVPQEETHPLRHRQRQYSHAASHSLVSQSLRLSSDVVSMHQLACSQ